MKTYLALFIAITFSSTLLAQQPSDQLYLIQQLAEQGEASAQHRLAEHYLSGVDIEQNYTLAFQWYKKAAEQNHAPAMFDLATAYDLGEGTEQNLTLAAFWYEKAARKGEASAAYNLGILYDDGVGIKKDALQASVWLRLADLLQHELAAEALAQSSRLFSTEHKQNIETAAQSLLQEIRAEKAR